MQERVKKYIAIEDLLRKYQEDIKGIEKGEGRYAEEGEESVEAMEELVNSIPYILIGF